MKKQFLKVGLCTLISRALGFIREFLFVRSLGARFISDAFLTAFRIPNTFYEIVAGGSFGPAVVPTLSSLLRTQGIQAANRFISLLSIIIAGVMTGIIALVLLGAPWVITAIVPGFSLEQQELSVSLLRILITIIFFSSSTALMAEALRTARHFIIPACGQIIVNSCFIFGLIYYYLSPSSLSTLAFFVVLGNVLQCIVHLIAWYSAGYRFCAPDAAAWQATKRVIQRIVPCMLTAGIAEIALFIELQFASYLPAGSVSLLFYASSFARLPFGIVVHSVVVVLLPELARIHTYAAQRIPYLLCEAYKVILWILLPLMALMFWFSYDIFATLYSSTMPSTQIITMQKLFIIKVASLIFLSFNHLILQLFYVRHETQTPTMVSLLSTVMSILLNILLMPCMGIYGLAISSTLTAGFRSFFLGFLAKQRTAMHYSFRRFFAFMRGIILQMVCIILPVIAGIESIRAILRLYPSAYSHWFTDSYGLWLWVAPLCAGSALLLWRTRTWCGIRLHFLDRQQK